MPKETPPTSNAGPKNIWIDSRIVECAESVVDKRKKTNRAFSFSQYVQDLLVEDLKRKKISLPKDFLEA